MVAKTKTKSPMRILKKHPPQAGYGRLIVKPRRDEEGMVNGVIVPGGSDNLTRGEVVSVGTPDKRYGDRDCPYKPGDVVSYILGHKDMKTGAVKQMAYLLLEGGTEYSVVLQVEVLAVVA